MEFSLLSLFPYAVLFISLSLSWIIYTKTSTTSTLNLPPGNMGLPFIGETLKFLSNAKRGWPEKFIYDRITKFSSHVFKTSLFGEPIVAFTGAPGNKFLFTNENRLVGPWLPGSIRKLFPLPKSASLEDESKKIRKILHNELLSPKSYDKLVKVMDVIAQRHFVTCWENEELVKVYTLVKRYTLWLAFGLFMSIEKPEEVMEFERQFDALASALISIPIDLPWTTFHRGVKASRIFQEKLLQVIKQRKIDMMREINSEASSTTTQDLLFHMLLFVDEHGERLDDQGIASQIIGLLLAGRDPASSAITFVVKYLAELPQVYDGVFKEQMEILRSKAVGDSLNWDDIKKMKYSWNVACEVMRLAPPTQGGFREAIKDFNYAGFSIPKGWKLYWSPSSTHKNPEYFPEPEKFDPSRFDVNGPAVYTYVPFGAGPKMCPGKEYSKLMILVFMHNIVKRFKWEKLLPNEDTTMDFFRKPANGLPVRLYPHK
ncbi:hypothetical protein Ancab_002565 [Ancistrocladus abbreviatus]